MREEKRFYTVRQAAEVLDVSDTMVGELIRRREIACHRIGRLIRITPEDLDAYVKSIRQPSNHERRDEVFSSKKRRA